MAWVRFKRDFDWRVPIRALVIQAYRGGRAYSVKAACARDAVAADAAEKIPAPAHGVDPNAGLDGEDGDGAGS